MKTTPYSIVSMMDRKARQEIIAIEDARCFDSMCPKRFCNYCDCEDCENGTDLISHAKVDKDNWICSTCYNYDLCSSHGHGPCDDKNCEHRPKLISEWHAHHSSVITIKSVKLSPFDDTNLVNLAYECKVEFRTSEYKKDLYLTFHDHVFTYIKRPKEDIDIYELYQGIMSVYIKHIEKGHSYDTAEESVYRQKNSKTLAYEPSEKQIKEFKKLVEQSHELFDKFDEEFIENETTKLVKAFRIDDDLVKQIIVKNVIES